MSNYKEKELLRILDDNENMSQREIARKTGISLGTVNSLIKKCVKKGLLKIERLNSRNLRYILTPAGLKEKMQRTLAFVKRSYQAIIEFKNRIKELTETKTNQGHEIWVLGEQDEIYQLVVDALKEINVDYATAQTITEIDTKKKVSVYYWDDDLIGDKLKDDSRLELINVLISD